LHKLVSSMLASW